MMLMAAILICGVVHRLIFICAVCDSLAREGDLETALMVREAVLSRRAALTSEPFFVAARSPAGIGSKTSAMAFPPNRRRHLE